MRIETKMLDTKKDDRGILVEVFKDPLSGQTHYIMSKPGITRGKHYHTRKTEEFCVIQGKAKITLRTVGTKKSSSIIVSGDIPQIVYIPKNTVHDITNVGTTDMICLVWCSEIFNPKDTDTISDIICPSCYSNMTDKEYHEYGGRCEKCRTRGWCD